MKILILIIVLILFSGCASVPKQVQINHEGNIALENKNYTLAKDKYQTALQLARKKGDRQYEAIAMYGMGRSHGYLCEYDEAKKWLLDSIALRKSISDSSDAYLSQNYLELARLSVSIEDYSGVVKQFESAIPLLESLGLEDTDPIGYANVLKDYAAALEKLGMSQRASEVEDKIQYLIHSNPDKSAVFTPRPYPKNCDG